MNTVVLLALAATVWAVWSANSQTRTIVLRSASTEFFVGSGGAHINCELDDAAYDMGSGYTTTAYCQSVSPAQSMHLGATGRATRCVGQQCLGNPGIGTPTFDAGITVILGPFRCQLGADEVRCQNARHGFVLSGHSTRLSTTF